MISEASSNGRTCDAHDVCGSVLLDDVVVRLRKVQILNTKGAEETTITAYLVSDGIDQCRVGFLPRHLVRHAKNYDGALAQITEVYTRESESPSKRKKYHQNCGCCLAAIISSIPPPTPAGSAIPLAKGRQALVPTMDDLALDVPADLGTDKNAQHDAAAQQGSTTAGDASEENVSMASSATSSSIQQQRGKSKAHGAANIAAAPAKKSKNALPATVTATPPRPNDVGIGGTEFTWRPVVNWFSDDSRDEDYVEEGEESACS